MFSVNRRVSCLNLGKGISMKVVECMIVFSFVLCGDNLVMAIEEKIGVGQGCSLRPHLFNILFGNVSDAARDFNKYVPHIWKVSFPG